MPAVLDAFGNNTTTTTRRAASTYPLTAAQRQVASQIVAAGNNLGASNEEIIAALSVGIAESNLRPEAVGDSGKAVGVFQQHPSYGDTAARQNVTTAATAFLKQLIGLRPKNEPIGTKAADVQRPALQYRGIYSENLDEALNVYNQVAGSPYSGSVADLRPTVDVTTTTTTVAGKVFNSGFAPFVERLISSVKGLTVTSGTRSDARNRAVGGVEDSQHLVGTAVDVAGSAEAKAQAKAFAQRYGLEAIDEGDHIHIELPGGKSYGTDYAGNLIETTPASVNPVNATDLPGTAPGVYKALDNVLNNGPGIVDTLTDPAGAVVTAGRLILARGTFAVAGLTVSVFGLILVVGAVATKSGASKVAKMVPPLTPATAAVNAAGSVADAVGEGD